MVESLPVVVSKKTQNGVGSRQHTWNIKFRLPQYDINKDTQANTLTSEKVFRSFKEYGYLCEGVKL